MNGKAFTKRAVVTGAAGFIGSHLTDRLLLDGWQVAGIDSFSDYYCRAVKESNLRAASAQPCFELIEGDLATVDLESLLEGVDVVFHLGGRSGVRSSWGQAFKAYLHDNVFASQRLFEAATAGGVQKLVYASSSSVYGDAEAYPTAETVEPRPISPYGMTKLATEQLASLYRSRFQVPVVGLRLFTVYGPRQRPDMFFNLLCRAVATGRSIEVFGDGEQGREYTYIDDAVEAFVAAANSGRAGEIYNIGGGTEVTVNEAIAILEKISGKRADVLYGAKRPGDARRTAADISKAQRELGFEPVTGLREGLEREYQWLLHAMPSTLRA